jgi:hypothetical protein
MSMQVRRRHIPANILIALVIGAWPASAPGATKPERATTASSCGNLSVNAGRYGGRQALRVIVLGRDNCSEATRVTRAFFGKMATNQCGRLNNFCDLTFPGGWSCSIFFAAESRETGGASARCYQTKTATKVRLYPITSHKSAFTTPRGAAP